MNNEAIKLHNDGVFELQATDQAETVFETGLQHSSSFADQMNLVITTGCPHSGWDMALPILGQAGFQPAGDAWARRRDEFFQAAGITDALQVRRPLQPATGIMNDVSQFLYEAPNAPRLLADSRSLWLLDFWALMMPNAQFLLFYTREETALAHAIQQGIDPLYFLEGWQATSRQLLQFQRRHRGRALLLDAEAACRQPQKMLEICRQFGLSVQPLPPVSMPALPTPAMERLLASHLLAARPGAGTLQSELEASAHPIGNTALPVQPPSTELFNDYLQRQGHRNKLSQQLCEAGEKLQAAEQAREQHTDEFRQLLSQIEQLTKSRDEQEKLSVERKLKHEQALQVNEGLETGKKEAAQENDLLLLQLHQFQEELETIFLQKQGLEKKQAEQAKLSVERKSQLEQASRVNEALEIAKKEVEQENELLLMQLHQVQEELESIFLQKQQLNQAYQTLKAAYQEIENGKAQLQSQLAKVQEELITKDEAQLQRVSKLKSTVSWRITTPVRAVSKLFKKADKKQDAIQEQIKLLETSGLFDARWYLAEYADVAAQNAEPFAHYLRHGAAEGRNPSPVFDTRFYIESNPDVAATGMNPLVHFVKYGRAEGRIVSNQ